ncbi:MAG: hypothetical protein LBD02_08920 [Christensenellaceae bacterium]|nr:hypothetical protein [Christensenellaceae bacterium]
MPKRQTEWSRAYNEKAYDRLAIIVPKGAKELVKQQAERNGESINGMVNRSLLREMGFEKWPDSLGDDPPAEAQP